MKSKKKKTLNKKTNLKSKPKNQNLNYERDGNTFERQTWPGKVVALLDGLGTEKQGTWFTHKAIQRLLVKEGIGPYENLGFVLYDLTKSGHLIRARKPNKIKDKQVHRDEFIYQRTNKVFYESETIPHTMKGFQLWTDYFRLPAWFRDMMH